MNKKINCTHFFPGRRVSVTLIEILVVVAIIAAATTTTLASFNIVGSKRLKLEMLQVLADINWAKELAKAHDTNTRITFSTANDTYYIEEFQTTNWVRVKPPNNVIQLVSDISLAPTSVVFSFPDASANLPHNPMTINGSSRIQLDLGERSVRIELTSATGYARLSVSTGAGSWCFIATAAYDGTASGAEAIKTLCAFRDNYLLTHPFGSTLVSLYYNISPPLARYIKKHAWAKIATRTLLTPIVWGCKKVMAK